MFLVFFIIVIIFIIVICIKFSKVQIEIKNFNIRIDFDNICNKMNQIKFENKIVFSLLIGKFKIFKININNKRVDKFYKKYMQNEDKKRKLNYINKDIIERIIKDKKIRKIINKIKLELNEMEVYILIGIKDVIVNSYLIAIISIIVSNIIPHIFNKINYKKVDYKIEPIYNKNILNTKCNFTILINMNNIINIVWNLRFFIKEEKLKYKLLNEK